MNFLRNAISEIIGLFVDDWLFAILLVVWVILAALASPHLSPRIVGPLFFLGLAALTLAFAVRQARRIRAKSRR